MGITAMLGSTWVRIGLVLAATGLIGLATMPAQGGEPPAYGERLVAQYRLPPATIARYAAMAAGTAMETAAREDSRFADRMPWVGPAQRAGSGHNPYTLVFTVSGVTRAAGEAYAHWQAGWDVRESPNASRELLMVVPRIVRTGLAAGQPVTLTANSGHVSFRDERHVAPMLGLVQMRNLDIHDVQVQVWSGEAPSAWSAVPWSRAAFLAAGVACLLAGLGYRYWQRSAQSVDLAPILLGIEAPPRMPAVALSASQAEPPAQQVHAGPAPETAAPVAAAAVPAAPPDHAARVLADLQQLLNFGLTVPTVLDETRPRRRTPTR